MEKYYSKVEPGKLLHCVHRISDLLHEGQRTDLIDPNNFIQCSFLVLPESGITFRPHKHKWKEPSGQKTIAQESWVVIRGMVRVYYYDLDNSLLGITIIESGDASFTLEGGHNYESLLPGTIVYEYKTGPYLGQELDKEFI